MFNEQQLFCFADKRPHTSQKKKKRWASSEIMQRNVGRPGVYTDTWKRIRRTHILCSVTPKRPVNEKASSTDRLRALQSIITTVTGTPYCRFCSVLFTQVEQWPLFSALVPNSPFHSCCCRSNFSPEMPILHVPVNQYWLY